MSKVCSAVKEFGAGLLRRTRESAPGLWATHLKEELGKPSGWQPLARFLAFCLAAYGLLLGLLTYQMQVRATLVAGSDQALARLVSDLNHAAEEIRIGAILQAPSLHDRPVPRDPYIKTFTDLGMALGGWMPTSPRLRDDIQRNLLAFASRGSSTNQDTYELIQSTSFTRQSTPKDLPWMPSSTLSGREVSALLRAFAEIGPDSWYGLEVREDRSPRPTPGKTPQYQWIWYSPHHHRAPIRIHDPASIFEHTAIESLALKGSNMTGVSFRNSWIVSADISHSQLVGADLSGAVLAFSDLSNAILASASAKRSNLVKADLSNSVLCGAQIRGSDLRYASLRDATAAGVAIIASNLDGAMLNNFTTWTSTSHAHRAKSSNHCSDWLGPRIYVSADFHSSTMRDADLSNARLAGANMDHTSLDGAVAANAVLRGASLRFASATRVDFSAADLSGANLEAADLRHAALASAKNLAETASVQDANIYGASLSPGTRQRLIGRGAVEIPGTKRWHDYRKAGRPHSEWKTYASSSDRK